MFQFVFVDVASIVDDYYFESKFENIKILDEYSYENDNALMKKNKLRVKSIYNKKQCDDAKNLSKTWNENKFRFHIVLFFLFFE